MRRSMISIKILPPRRLVARFRRTPNLKWTFARYLRMCLAISLNSKPGPLVLRSSACEANERYVVTQLHW